MEEQNNKPNENVRVATTSEERIAGMLLDAIQSFNVYFGITNGIEDKQLTAATFGGRTPGAVEHRRVGALISSLNSLKQVIRISKPILAEVVDQTIEKNDVAFLEAIRKDINLLLNKTTTAFRAGTKDTYLIYKETISVNNYAEYRYTLTNRFHEAVAEVEELFEETYRTIFKNGLLTPLKQKQEKRGKLNDF